MHENISEDADRDNYEKCNFKMFLTFNSMILLSQISTSTITMKNALTKYTQTSHIFSSLIIKNS